MTHATSAPPQQPAARQPEKVVAELKTRMLDMKRETVKTLSNQPRLLKLIALLPILIALMSTGCAYTKIQVPMDRDFNNTQLGSEQA